MKTRFTLGKRALPLVLYTIGALLLAVNALPAAADTPGPYNIKIEQVDAHDFPLVTLYVSITDPASGDPVLGLVQDQFTVTEDGQEAEIVDFSAGNQGAIFTVLTIDRSGSMDDQGKMQGAKEAARAFAAMMRPQDQVALIVFNSRVNLWQNYTNDQARLRRRIDDLYPDGGTAWLDAVWETVDLMATVTGRRNAILLSDGMDNESDHSFPEVVAHAQAADVAIHTIGLGSGSELDEDMLQGMAAETGGTYHHTPSAFQLRALYKSFAEATQKEYVITFKSSRASYDGTRRNIQVAVGGSAGGGRYVETHLLNVRSSPLVALAFAFPLALALVMPVLRPRLQLRRQRSATPESLPQVSPPPAPAAQPTCPRCGRPVRVGARFCGYCRTPLTSPVSPPGSGPAPPTAVDDRGTTSRAAATQQPAVATCAHCGGPLRTGARFCGRCGKRVGS